MWQVEGIIMLRHIIDDLGDSPTYSDSRLEELFLVAAQLIKFDVNFTNDYTIDVDAGTLSPDPTTSTKDYAFISLVCLKAACILQRADARTSAGQAIDIRDGRSAISLKGVFAGKIAMAKSYCEAYEKAKLEHTLGNLVVGRAIMGPIASEDLNWSPYNYYNGRG